MAFNPLFLFLISHKLEENVMISVTCYCVGIGDAQNKLSFEKIKDVFFS